MKLQQLLCTIFYVICLFVSSCVAATSTNIPVGACSVLSEAGATYELSNNIIVSSSSSSCLTVSSRNITVYGNGFYIRRSNSNIISDCIKVLSEDVTIKNTILNCSTGITTQNSGTKIIESLIGSGNNGIVAVNGNYLTIERNIVLNMVSFGSSDAVGISVKGGKEIKIENNIVSFINGAVDDSNGANAIGIRADGATQVIIKDNSISAVSTKVATGGYAAGIEMKGGNGEIEKNNINLIIGGNAKMGLLGLNNGGDGGNAFGIKCDSGSFDISSNSMLGVRAGNGAAGLTGSGGSGGIAKGISLSSSSASFLSLNSVSGVVGGDGEPGTLFLAAGNGGDACGISNTQGQCVSIEGGNNISGIIGGEPGASLLGSVKKGVASSVCLTSVSCARKVNLIAPTQVNAQESNGITVTTILNGDLITVKQRINFECDDASVVLPPSQLFEGGVINFNVVFSIKGVKRLRACVNVTCAEANITVIADPPSKPDSVNLIKYARDYLLVGWTDVSYTQVQLFISQDSFNWISFNTSSTQYQASNLDKSRVYYIYLVAYNVFGASPDSEIRQFTTADEFCGDSICDLSENCSSCYFDCAASCGIEACGECYGTCENSVCICPESFFGPSCSNSSNTTPASVKVENSTFVLSVSNEINFHIRATEAKEIDSKGNIIANYNLENVPVYFTQNSSGSLDQHILTYNFDANSIKVISELSKTERQYNFAGKVGTVPANIMKIWVMISSWQFSNISNVLQIKIESLIPSANTKIAKKVGEGNNLIWLHIMADNFSLYETFAEQAELDSEVRRVKFSHVQDGEILIEIPHFWTSALIDPNYAALIDPLEPSADLEERDEKSKKKPKIPLPLIIGLVVGAIVLITAFMIVKRVYDKKQRAREAQRVRAKLSKYTCDVDI